jgi:hypothetical protein
MGSGSGAGMGSGMGMEPTAAGLIRIFASLTPTQRSAAVRALNEFLEGTPQQRERLINESQRHYIAKVDLGPLSNVCPYCGR